MLAVIAIGRGFIGSSLGTRRWQLWVSLHHNKDSAGPVPGRVCPRIVANFGRISFCKSRRFANPVPERPYRANRPTQLRTNRGEFIGNLRISAQPVSRVRDLPRDDRRHVFNTRFPVLLPRSPAAGTTLGSRLQNATFCAWYAFLVVARTCRALMPVPKPIYGGAWQRAAWACRL